MLESSGRRVHVHTLDSKDMGGCALSVQTTINHRRTPVVQGLALDQHDRVAVGYLVVANGEAFALYAEVALYV